ncbi:MAG: aspartyl protease family protein [Candidatus Rokubacteria bacterium]|nr:aspartyl protease family protein [Candidatus Rokubacteria bacterium]
MIVAPARRAMRVAFVAALGVVAVLIVAGTATAQVYRWTDDAGVTHLSTNPDRIPPQHRGQVQVLESSGRPPAETAPSDSVMRITPGNAIYAEAWLNGVPVTLLVDTGATRTLLAPGVLARAGVDVQNGRPVRVIGVSGNVTAVEVVVPRLDVAGTQIGPLAVIAHEIPELRADGLLGRDVLEHFTLTIDAARGRATLTR